MSLCACAKSWAVNDALNVKTVVLVSIDLLYNASNVDRLVASMAISTTFSIDRNGYLWASGENSDTTIQFFDSNFLSRCEILANLEVFSSDFLHFWCWVNHNDNVHQVWSSYDHPLRYCCLWFNSGRSWRVMYSTLPPSLKIILSIHELHESIVGYQWEMRSLCACAESHHVTGE